MAKSFILSKPKACKVSSINVMSLDDALKNLSSIIGDVGKHGHQAPNNVSIPSIDEAQRDVVPVKVVGMFNGSRVHEIDMLAPVNAASVKTSSMKFNGYVPKNDIERVSNGSVVVELMRDVSDVDVITAANAIANALPHWNDFAKFSKSDTSFDEAIKAFMKPAIELAGFGTQMATRSDGVADGREISAMAMSGIVIGYEPNDKSIAALAVSAISKSIEIMRLLINGRAKAVIEGVTYSDISNGVIGIYSLVPLFKVKGRVRIISEA